MYISNNVLVKKYFTQFEDGKKLYYILLVVYKLIEKFWKRLKNEVFLNKISEVDKEIVFMIKLLGCSWKLNLNDVRQIISLLRKERKDIPKIFEISVYKDENIDAIKEKLNNMFGKSIEINVEETNKLILNVRWEWWYYKRWLDKDLNKLLGF